MSDDSCGFDNTKNTMASADPLGRFPANLIHDGSDEVVGLFPEKVEGKDNFKHSATSIFGSKSKDNTYNGNSKSSWGSASRFFKVCQLTTEDLCLDQSQISFVQYVESKLTGHEKLTVPESVAILVAQEDSPYQEELQVIQDFIGSYKRCTQHQNNVDVEKWENTDIIPIILNLLKLSGYVLNAIDKNINLENHKASGNNEPSRLLYCAKASKAERNTGLDGFTNGHPTIKPVKLMQYLCRLITPKDGIVLDPFMGSGSTGIGAKNERFNFIGIELDFEYFKIAQARIDSVEEQLF
ncbi:MAG: site-specific DNA-methyltransferase [Gammaproteobacteria bacterium]|nr:site-specific DNA-methyltransferase [Gammaproteobacteria bacterium]